MKKASPAQEGAPIADTDLNHFEGNPDFVLSLARGLKVIEAFQGQTDGMTVADIASRTRLSRAAVRRLLLTLELLGFAQHNGSIFRLRAAILRLGFSYLSSDSLPTLAQPLLEDVTAKTHESCSLAILDGDEVIYVARAAAKRLMSVSLSIGSRLPAYCTSMGRVLLGGLNQAQLKEYLGRLSVRKLTPKTVVAKSSLAAIIERARSDGYALVDEELEIGLRSIAVPVRNRSGRLIAAVNTGVHASRVPPEVMVERFVPILRQSAQLLGHLLD